MAKTAAEEAPFLLILDSLEDPHNFGSILRTADASGVSGVIIRSIAQSVSPLSDKGFDWRGGICTNRSSNELSPKHQTAEG